MFNIKIQKIERWIETKCRIANVNNVVVEIIFKLLLR